MFEIEGSLEVMSRNKRTEEIHRRFLFAVGYPTNDREDR